jgi:P-type conjugative transfer protein TrbG
MKSMIPIGVATLALAACSSGAPPQISYDEAMTPAVQEAAPAKPVQVVPLPEPLPLPGQLKPVEAAAPAKPEPADPLARVRAANAAAKIDPVRDGYINAIQVYPYAEGALYQLYTATLKVTDIALQEGEALISVAAGDTVRWTIGDTESGQGSSKRVHILVKPTRPGLDNDIVINTSRRTYHLEAHSSEGPYMAAVSWSYPYDQLLALQKQNARAEDIAATTAERGLDLARLKFRYAITGDTPPWRPVRAFDDGEKVYIQFPSGIAQGEMPPLFVVGPTGETELVNYRVRGTYYVVDRLFGAAELRLGHDPQQIVRISRTDQAKS